MWILEECWCFGTFLERQGDAYADSLFWQQQQLQEKPEGLKIRYSAEWRLQKRTATLTA